MPPASAPTTPTANRGNKAPYAPPRAAPDPVLDRMNLATNARYVMGALEHAIGALPDDVGPEWMPSVEAIRACYANLDGNGVSGTVAFLDHLVNYLDLGGAFHGRLLAMAGEHFRDRGLARADVVAALPPDLRRRWDAIGHLLDGLPRPPGQPAGHPSRQAA